MYQVTPMSPTKVNCPPGCGAAHKGAPWGRLLWGQHVTTGDNPSPAGVEGRATPYIDGQLGMAGHMATSWEQNS
ncbi:hypothetical protein Hamer_G000069 [Homarus americanus]|uniref:Uncharacterized protein n=1 Tax=Homarus americanus TaxID=6706 RepID=A0A8J5NCF9_HOMAM|nr:hypothetical protein Hamer_G000069 [Homarus americanus]